MWAYDFYNANLHVLSNPVPYNIMRCIYVN